MGLNILQVDSSMLAFRMLYNYFEKVFSSILEPEYVRIFYEYFIKNFIFFFNQNIYIKR